MRLKGLRLLGLFIITPLTVLASGQYIIPSLLIDLGLFILIMIIIFTLKITWTGKLILFLSYLAAMFLLFYLLDQLNTLEDITLVNIESALLPPVIVYVTYRLIRDRFKKSDR